MRFDVHTVRVHLVNELIAAPQVKEVWHDGSDVVILDFKSGEVVSIHMVERYMSVDDIDYIFRHNAEQGHYTMLILWADMFMPSHGQVYTADDWMLTLLQLFGGKIYAFDAWREQPYIFSVHFQPIQGRREYLVRHGADVNIGQVGVDVIETTLPYFHGYWRVARFDGVAGDASRYWEPPADNRQGTRASIRYYLNVLGLGANATREQVKQAYRDKAREHHPDRNQTSDSTTAMQTINDAYERIMRYLNDDEAGTTSQR